MRQKSILMFAAIIVLTLGLESASAQFTISIPKIPKIKKTNTEQTKTDTTTTTTTVNTDTTNTQTTETRTNSGVQDKWADSLWLKTHVENIREKQKEIEEYTPEDKIRLVSSSTYDYLLFAVSQKERTKWLKGANALDIRQSPNNTLDPALDSLAAAAAKKLPSYKSNLKDFTVRNAAEEKLMKGVLTRIADYKIFSIGLMQTNWLIDKNDLGIPTARYKYGVVYLSDTTDDHPYCYATYINVIQDYAGGGTYGASYALFIKDELVGCPAGQ